MKHQGLLLLVLQNCSMEIHAFHLKTAAVIVMNVLSSPLTEHALYTLITFCLYSSTPDLIIQRHSEEALFMSAHCGLLIWDLHANFFNATSSKKK